MLKYVNLTLSILSLVIIGLVYVELKKPDESDINPENALEQGYMAADTAIFINARSWDLPEELQFAGEEVPLDRTYIRELLDRELHINTYWHNNTIFLMKRANRWFPSISKILAAEGIPDDFKYVAVIESGLQNVVSPANATGFWQFVKPTAEEFGLEVSKDVDERYHPLKSTLAATRYLKQAYERFGNWTNVAAAYNRGMNGLERDLERQQVENYYDVLMNQETARYLFRVLAIKEVFTQPEKYGFVIKPEHLYQPEETRMIEVSESIEDLTEWAQEQGINYLLLKRHNPWLRTNKLTINPGNSYTILIPVNG